MIYLEEKFNLIPASPATLDKFVDLAQKQLVPTCDRLGAQVGTNCFCAKSTNISRVAGLAGMRLNFSSK